jgi:hypothetical protein
LQWVGGLGWGGGEEMLVTCSHASDEDNGKERFHIS